jgi:hypothetical protein
MRAAHAFLLMGSVGAGVCGYVVVSALHKGYVRGSRSRGHNYIYRRERPGLYWTSVVINLGMGAVCLALVGLALLSADSFR